MHSALETAGTSDGAASRGEQTRPRNILLVTDAWKPQTNGVVTTLVHVTDELSGMGCTMTPVHPALFRTIPCPRYPQIRLAIKPGRRLRDRLEQRDYEAIHIPAEGPLGLAARRWCMKRGIPFTSSYHTQYARYVRRYSGVPVSWTMRALRWFHGAAKRTLVPSQSIKDELEGHGFDNIQLWTRGVDAELFHPRTTTILDHLPGPIFTYVGRVAIEKNLEAFLSLDLPGSKMIVGDGPARPALERRFPDVYFAGFRFGDELAQHYSAADVFVFPSHTDTFGVVLLEAMACGTPVAAYPVTGPRDVVKSGVSGVLDDDLRAAALSALELDPAACRAHALTYTWKRCAEIFLDTLAPIEDADQCATSGPNVM